jgi:hypothetical protein
MDEEITVASNRGVSLNELRAGRCWNDLRAANFVPSMGRVGSGRIWVGSLLFFLIRLEPNPITFGPKFFYLYPT